jgi:hypothetical protein
VTFVDRLPGDYHRDVKMEVEGLPGITVFWVATAAIDTSYFRVLQAPMIAGRACTSADLAPEARVVIVDQGFADLVVPGRNPIGHRVRRSAEQLPEASEAERPWYEIVGVVKELGMAHPVERNRPAGMYMPAMPGRQGGLAMIVHGRGEPLTIGPRLRELATAVDPALRIEALTPMDQVLTPLLWFLGLWMKIIMGLTAVALLLSLSGIYAVLSYNVARRTREIGVRVALGASAHRVITSIFRRPLIHVTLGVMAGSVLIGLAAIGIQRTQQFAGLQGRGLTLGEMALLIGYALFMLGVCLLACVVPTIRALRVQPTEALRAE